MRLRRLCLVPLSQRDPARAAARAARSNYFEHLLPLAQHFRMGYTDERQCAAVLRSNHLKHEGAPPRRRRVDDPALSTQVRATGADARLT